MPDIAHPVSAARNIVFVDSRVEDATTLLQGIQSGTEVVFLQAGQDGLVQMAAALGERGDVGAVQVIAHGSAGQLWLGNRFLDNAALQRPEVQAQLAALGRGLTADGDLLIYACNTAQGSEGAQFVSTLAALTGADVAASDNRTGAGGDWGLEITTGHIAAPAALSQDSMAAYDQALATFTVTTVADSGPGSLRQTIINATNAAGPDTIEFAPDMSGKTITINSGTQLNIATDLQINGDIDGNGTADITIRTSGPATRVLNITEGTVVLNGLIIKDGSASSKVGSSNPEGNAFGSGISVTGAGTVVTILHSSITDNRASGGTVKATGGNGGNGGEAVGGVYIGSGATVQMAVTSVTGNKGTGGAGSFGSDQGGNGGNGTGGVLVASGGTFRYEASTVTLSNTGTGGAGGGAGALGLPGSAGLSTANISGTADDTWVFSTPPTVTGVTASSANGTYKVGDTLSLQVVFSENVIVTGTPQLTLETGGIDRVADYASGTGTSTLTFTYTVQTGDTSADLDYLSIAALALNSGTLRDASSTNAVLTLPTPGAAGSLADNAVIAIDGVVPDVTSIHLTGPATTNATSVNYTVTFSEAVIGVDTSDFTMAGAGTAAGTVAAVSGSGSTYTVTVGGITGDGTLRLNLNNADTFIADAAGNAITSGFTSGQSYTVDTTTPPAPSTPDLISASDSGTSSSDDITTNTTPTFTGAAESGSTVTLYETDGITALGTGTATGGNWSITIAPALIDGMHTLTAKATDAAGNTSAASAALNITIDAAAPTVASINRVGSASTNATSVDYTVTFSEAVTGVDTSDFALTSYGAAGGTVASVTGSGSTYAVTVNSIAGNGTLRLDLNSGGTGITDLAGNAAAGFTAGQSYTIDTVTPAASSTPDLATASDTGISNTDNITKVTTPKFSGTAEKHSTVTLYDTDGKLLGSTTADNIAGKWNITSTALTEGTHTLTAKATDVAGNVSAASSSLGLTIDTTAPTFASATVNGNTLVLTYTEATTLDAAHGPDIGDFAVVVGATANAVNGVAVNAAAKTVTLTLATAVSAGQAVTVAYTDPNAGDDANAIQDAAGNDAATLAATAVTNTTPTPDPGTPPTPPSTPVDGVPVVTTPGDGGTTIVTIPVVVPNRPENPSTPNTDLADIPLVTAPDGRPIVQVSVPVGVGLQAQGLPNPVTGDAAITELGLRIARASGNSEMIHDGSVFLATLDPSIPLTIQTITATAGAGFDPNVPFVISGSAAPGDGMQAIILDARALPAGTLVQVDNIDFIAIVGAVRVIGGAGQNIASGDSANQWIVLGADDDVSHGGGGNDVVASKGGNDRLFGDDGNDIIIGGTGNDYLEGGAGNDILQGGMSDAGLWSFALNADGTLDVSYAASQKLLTDVHSAALTGNWSGGPTLDASLAMAFADYGQLETISLVFQGLTGELPSLQSMNTLSALGLNQAELVQAAWNWYEATLPASASTQGKLEALITQTWGQDQATPEHIQVGVDFLAQGGTWAQALEFLVNSAPVRSAITSNGKLQLIQASYLGEMGWGADSGDDTLLGGAGNDVLIGGGGNNILDGGEGTDMAVLWGNAQRFSFKLRTVDGQAEVVLRNALTGEQDILRSIELVEIGGQAYRLQTDQLQEGQSYQLAEHLQALTKQELVLVGLPDASALV